MTKVAWLYHMRGLRQRDIASRLGISQSRVSRLLDLAGGSATGDRPEARNPRHLAVVGNPWGHWLRSLVRTALMMRSIASSTGTPLSWLPSR